LIQFKKISEIIYNQPQSWNDRNIFITFDIDWADDKVMEDTIDFIEKYDVPATWFVTHKTPVL